jgi:hypothetical protein
VNILTRDGYANQPLRAARRPAAKEKGTSMKRFLLFAYREWFPAGGWGDFIQDFDTVDGAMEFLKSYRLYLYTDDNGVDVTALLAESDARAEIVDTQTGECVNTHRVLE